MRKTMIAVAVAALTVAPSLRAEEAPESPVDSVQQSSVDRFVVHIRGMACPFCSYGVEKKLRALPGARNVSIDLEGGRATFEAPSGTISEKDIRRAIRKAGFKAHKIEVSKSQAGGES